jgi:outer membrane immunogenic protein
MNKSMMLGVALATLLVRGPAIAADMPLKAPPAPYVSSSWGGFYIGGHVGYGWGSQTSSVNDPSVGGGVGAIGFPPGFSVLSPNNDNHGNVRGGVLLGYNWQVAPSWVVGLEGDWSTGSLRNGGAVSGLTNINFVVPSGFASVRTEVNDIGTIRGRLGYTTPDWMLYATGGVAFASFNYSGDFGCAGDALCNTPVHAPVAFSKTKTGWVVGGGVEHKLAGGPWILGLEYLYYGFGGESANASVVSLVTGAPSGFGPCAGGKACVGYSFGEDNIQTVRARLSYKFN